MMSSKKDPGKFTIRFNIADPQQRAAAELLNQQGRCKAQFITNAVLFYASSSQNLIQHRGPLIGGEQIRHIAEDILAQQEEPAIEETSNTDIDSDAIFKTLEAFQQQ